MPYDWITDWPGVFERHADRCSFADSGMCTCGPLGYIASIPDPDTGARVTSPMLETAGEARAWRREQELTVDHPHAAAANGNGRGSHAIWHEDEDAPEAVAAPIAREPRPRAAPAGEPSSRARRELRPPRPGGAPAPAPRPDPAPRPASPRSRAYGTPTRAPRHDGTPVSALIDMFLDAAEAGEARGRDGRPYSDDELAEFEWAFAGYVEGQFADLNASAVRGRHIFRLIDELEDAGMPRSRLRSVVTAVRELFDYAAEIDLVQVNPATYVSLPPDERRTRTRLRETLETRMPPASPDASGGAFTGSVISERAIWMSVKMVALIFICIALVLVAESV